MTLGGHPREEFSAHTCARANILGYNRGDKSVENCTATGRSIIKDWVMLSLLAEAAGASDRLCEEREIECPSPSGHLHLGGASRMGRPAVSLTPEVSSYMRIASPPSVISLAKRPSKSSKGDKKVTSAFSQPMRARSTKPPGRLVCHICQYSTNHTSHMKRHVRGRHAGEKPFACEQCPYRCAQRANLKRHVRYVGPAISFALKLIFMCWLCLL